MSIKIVKLYDDAIVPKRAHPTDSGLDIYMHNIKKLYTNSGGNGERCIEDDEVLKRYLYEKELVLAFGWRALIGTGLKASVSAGAGYEIQVRPRSGLALNKGLTILNTPGTIDESYRDEISVILINLSRAEQHIKFGDRIAQLVIAPVCLDDVEIVNSLGGNDRKGGFGSTDHVRG